MYDDGSALLRFDSDGKTDEGICDGEAWEDPGWFGNDELVPGEEVLLYADDPSSEICTLLFVTWFSHYEGNWPEGDEITFIVDTNNSYTTTFSYLVTLGMMLFT
mmetsp:Transcript_44782/g.43376  ORF Transcript_44782/g.43376 Transcript_44782/m.43376 type:complete len:104 (+) Transcript_44782:271-582(+)